MRSERYLYNWGVVFFFLTVALAFFSWIGSIYGIGEVQSLLSAEGIRWILSHVVENYVCCPAFGIVLFVLMGVGIMDKAGLLDTLKRLCQREKQLSRKERRALVLSVIALFLYVMLFVIVMLLPWNFLLSATGKWYSSPLSKGIVYVLSVGLGISGMVYGYTADVFSRLSDIVEAMSTLIARYAGYFVVLLFVVHFFSSLEYTRLFDWMGIPYEVAYWAFFLCSYLPIVLLVGKVRRG